MNKNDETVLFRKRVYVAVASSFLEQLTFDNIYGVLISDSTDCNTNTWRLWITQKIIYEGTFFTVS